MWSRHDDSISRISVWRETACAGPIYGGNPERQPACSLFSNVARQLSAQPACTAFKNYDRVRRHAPGKS